MRISRTLTLLSMLVVLIASVPLLTLQSATAEPGVFQTAKNRQIKTFTMHFKRITPPSKDAGQIRLKCMVNVLIWRFLAVWKTPGSAVADCKVSNGTDAISTTSIESRVSVREILMMAPPSGYLATGPSGRDVRQASTRRPGLV